MNPFTAGGWGTSSGNPPSIFGALPSVPVSSSAPRSIQADSVQYKLTNFNTTVLNCTVVGPQNHVVYRVVTNSGAPSSTMWKDNESRNVGMVTWQPNATLELYKLQSTAPRVLARIARLQSSILLDMTPEAMQLGLLEPCVVATVIFTCGHNID
ncbi:predicted protein [Postia placenta Mad-698-R]|nr:predicted protein [Postia placenta Mad-698-R]